MVSLSGGGGLYDNALKQLNVIQNYILRIIFFKDRMYSSNFLYNESILNVRCLYYLNICTFCFKSTNKSFVNHCYQTRQNANNMMVIPFRKFHTNQRFASILAPKMYNILPHEIRTTIKYNLFVKKCKAFIHQNRDYITNLL